MAKKPSQPSDDRTVVLLEQILKVLALQVASDKSISEAAQLLKVAGLDNKTIAQVLNTTDATVRASLSAARRAS
jgi:DNA-directed RNA polymerase specialized sigma24 family protein